MRTAILSIILGCAASFCFGQKSVNPTYKIRAQRGAVTVSFKGKAHWLNLGPHIDAEKITDIELMFAVEREDFRYLVIDVTGWSRKEQNDRQCGAGVESNLIWVKLDREWKMTDAKSVRYQSCWSGADLNDPFVVTKNSLSVDYDDIRPRLNVKLFYNADEPEKGFQIVETKLPEN